MTTTTTRGLIETAEAILMTENPQHLYRAGNGMKMCDCGDRWIVANQDRCLVCANVTPCGDPECGCAAILDGTAGR